MGLFNRIACDLRYPNCGLRVEWQSKFAHVRGKEVMPYMETIAIADISVGEMHTKCGATIVVATMTTVAVSTLAVYVGRRPCGCIVVAGDRGWRHHRIGRAALAGLTVERMSVAAFRALPMGCRCGTKQGRLSL
jgi:hypothetical protein